MGYTDVTVRFVWVTCCYEGCGVLWGQERDFDKRRRQDREWFYCPNGHRQHYTGQNNEEKLREAEAREVHLKDQLAAATRNEEAARSELLRIRGRIAAGICPCCRRTFSNVARHMESQHPDFAVPKDAHRPLTFECSCGYIAQSYLGLRIHQGKNRTTNWDREPSRAWSSHLTVVPT
jgi:hypothetical protein